MDLRQCGRPVAALAATLAAALAGCDRPAGPPAPPRSGADVGPVAQAAEPAAAAPLQTASPAGDAAVSSRVKAALRADPELKRVSIDVDTRDGEVTLRGALDRDAQVARAIAVARGVAGVANVVNRLTVKNEDKAAHSSRG